jgi:hypothetical protein
LVGEGGVKTVAVARRKSRWRRRGGRDCSLAVALKGDMLDPGRTFNERSANMTDQKLGANDHKQVATSKDEKAAKPATVDQKPNGIASGASSTGNNTATTTAPATTKMELATEIYKRMRTVKDVTRKDIIERFIADVKLTKAGASTYYQLLKDKHEPRGKK